MAAHESVIFAFLRRREGTDATQLAVGVKLFATASQYFVPIGLMSYIPDNAVVWRVIDIVQGYRNLSFRRSSGYLISFNSSTLVCIYVQR